MCCLSCQETFWSPQGPKGAWSPLHESRRQTSRCSPLPTSRRDQPYQLLLAQLHSNVMHSNAKKPRFCCNLPRHFTPPILFGNHGRSSSFAQVVRYSHLDSQVTIWYGNQEQQERQKTETWPSQKINSMDKIQDCVLFPFLKWGSPVPPSVAALTGSWAEAFGYSETGSLGPHQN